MYATYQDYAGRYGGTSIKETDWPRLELRAAAYVDLLTYDRLKLCETVPEAAMLAVCAVAEVVQEEEKAAQKTKDSAGVKSFSNDGYSETLTSPADLRKQFDTEKRETAGLYLPLSHPLRYAGV